MYALVRYPSKAIRVQAHCGPWMVGSSGCLPFSYKRGRHLFSLYVCGHDVCSRLCTSAGAER